MMAWSNAPRRRDDKKFTSVRLTGLFKTQKRGLCVGTIQPETIAKMIEKIKEAKKDDKELVLFLWVNDKKDEENQPYFTVSMDVSRPKPQRGRAIDPDPFDDTDDRDGTRFEKEKDKEDPFS